MYMRVPGKLMPKAEKTELTQVEKFRELARELEADEDEAAFEEQVKKVAKNEQPRPKEG